MSFEEKLVESVRQNSVLYDLSNMNYQRPDIKDKIWRDISLNLQSKESIFKTRWKSLRDTYRKARRTEPSGSPAIDRELRKKKWKYYELISFLDRVDDQNQTVGNFDNSNYESTTNSTNTSKKKTVSSKNQINNNFCNFLNTASKAISDMDKAPTSVTTSIMILFQSLALKIERANLPSDVLNEIEIEITNLVYRRLRDHKRNS